MRIIEWDANESDEYYDSYNDSTYSYSQSNSDEYFSDVDLLNKEYVSNDKKIDDLVNKIIKLVNKKNDYICNNLGDELITEFLNVSINKKKFELDEFSKILLLQYKNYFLQNNNLEKYRVDYFLKVQWKTPSFDEFYIKCLNIYGIDIFKDYILTAKFFDIHPKYSVAAIRRQPVNRGTTGPDRYCIEGCEHFLCTKMKDYHNIIFENYFFYIGGKENVAIYKMWYNLGYINDYNITNIVEVALSSKLLYFFLKKFKDNNLIVLKIIDIMPHDDVLKIKNLTVDAINKMEIVTFPVAQKLLSYLYYNKMICNEIIQKFLVLGYRYFALKHYIKSDLITNKFISNRIYNNISVDVYKLINFDKTNKEYYEMLLNCACKYNHDDIFEETIKKIDIKIINMKNHLIDNIEYLLGKKYPFKYASKNSARCSHRMYCVMKYISRKGYDTILFYKKDYRLTYIVRALCENKIDNIEWIVNLIKSNKISENIIRKVFKCLNIINNKENRQLILKNGLPCNLKNVKVDEYMYYHLNIFSSNINLLNIEIFNQIDKIEIIKLREMFKTNKLKTVIDYVEENNISLDQFCIDNAYYYKNIDIMSGITNKCTNSCALRVAMKNNKYHDNCAEVLNSLLVNMSYDTMKEPKKIDFI
jgi:hypothetical protein